MARIVPSQVIAYIDQVIPADSWPYLGSGNFGQLTGLLDLIDKIPDELLLMDSQSHSDFILALSTIRAQLTIWTYGGLTSPPDLFGNQQGRPMKLVRNSLAKCPDEAPALSTTDLTFITDAEL